MSVGRGQPMQSSAAPPSTFAAGAQRAYDDGVDDRFASMGMGGAGGDGGRPPPVTYVPAAKTMDELMAEKVEVGLNFAHITEEHVNRAGADVDKIPVYESFDEASLPRQVKSNIDRLGYKRPTPVQRHVMPLMMHGRDVLASAQTGSGKTAAFLLPIIAKLLNEEAYAQREEMRPRALIIAPTRELVIQIANEGRKFAYDTPIKVSEVYGGVAVAHHQGNVQGASIIVATIGRLKHFLEGGVINLSSCRYLVIDEVDRMLVDSRSKNEERDLPELIERHAPRAGLAPPGERHTAMFSATIDQQVQQLTNRFTKNTALVGVGLVGAANKDIKQTFIQVSRYQKKEKLLELLRNEAAEAKARGKQIGRTLVFVNERKTTDVLAMILSGEAHDIPSISIHGLREQRERETALSHFRQGRCRVLIATAVCERGLDIKDVDHVVNYDLPDDAGQYVHRIGRTGRVGHAGRATSFYETGRDSRLIDGLYKVLTESGQPVPDFMGGGGGSYGYGPSSSSFGTAAADDAW